MKAKKRLATRLAELLEWLCAAVDHAGGCWVLQGKASPLAYLYAWALKEESKHDFETGL
jgi:hypothetical protein